MTALSENGIHIPATTITLPPVLEVKDLSIRFTADDADNAAVQNVSFSIPQGHVLALVGESGSGKSLTAAGILGLLPVGARIAEGSILFCDGTNAPANLIGLSDKRLNTFRGSGIGMVFQNPLSSLDPSFRIGRQLDEVLSHHRPKSTRAERLEIGTQWLRRVGFDDPERTLDAYPHELSGGMRQRAMIALASLAEPALLIADEPTTALDTVVQRQILDLLRDVTRTTGGSLLLITHDFDVVDYLADAIVVLRRGVVVEAGPRERVLTAPRDRYTRELLAAVPRLGRRSTLPQWHGPRALTARRVADGAPATAPGSGPVVLTLSHVTKRFAVGGWGTGIPRRQFAAVDNVSLEVRAGEIYGLIGSSGSGKSTLARLMGGLLAPSSGSVEFSGQEITGANRQTMRAIRPRLQYVFQDPVGSLNPNVLVGEQIGLPLKRFGLIPEGTRVRDRVAEKLELVGLPAEFADRYPHSLSGGQAQRVCIARVLALSPELLILDEPTSALDVSTQADVIDLILDLRERLDLTCVFIGHGLGLVEWACDRIGVMSRGQLVDSFPTEQLQDADRSTAVRELLDADLGTRKVRQS